LYLVSFALSPPISILDVMAVPNLCSIFTLPMSIQVHNELAGLEERLEQMVYNNHQMDSWILLNGSIIFSVKNYYKGKFKGIQVPKSFPKIWKCRCTMRIKLFGWLTLVNRLNTRDILRRKNLLQGHSSFCTLCQDVRVEDIEHLFSLVNLLMDAGGSLVSAGI
jgi:hypothetical protein